MDKMVLGKLELNILPSPWKTVVSRRNADSILRLWNMQEGGMAGEPFEGQDVVTRYFNLPLDVLEIASGSEDGTARLWIPDTDS
jgi:WD40 repeat protein